jgi:CheY-like chemotaxis protein
VQVGVLEPGEEKRSVERIAGIEPHRGWSAEPEAEAPRCILVVDDNPTNRKVVEALLRKIGVQTVSAQNGQDAVDALVTRGIRPDLVLMDVQMPVMDGLKAADAIRRWEKETGRPRLGIIALTAGAYDEDRQQCLAAGMDDFLAKPISLNDLALVVKQRLGARGQS